MTAMVKRAAACAAKAKVREVAMALKQEEPKRTLNHGDDSVITLVDKVEKKYRRYPCSVCGKRFLSRSHIREHLRIHTGERPFQCDRCESSFTTHHNLKRHQSIHVKEEKYTCHRCGVLFCQRHARNSKDSSSPSSPERNPRSPLPESSVDREMSELPNFSMGEVRSIHCNGEKVEMVTFHSKAGKLRKVAYEIEVVI